MPFVAIIFFEELGQAMVSGAVWSYSGLSITSCMILAFYAAKKGGRRRLRQMPYSYVHGPVTDRQARGGMLL